MSDEEIGTVGEVAGGLAEIGVMIVQIQEILWIH